MTFDIKETQTLTKEISQLKKETKNINTQIKLAKFNDNSKEQNRLFQEKIYINNQINIKQQKLNNLLNIDKGFNQNTQLKHIGKVAEPTSIFGLVSKLGIATVGLVVGFTAVQGQAHATSFNMISNGEFEETRSNLRYQNGSGRYDYASYQLRYSDWEVDSRYAYHSWLKQEGYSSIDTTGTDGLETGNFFAGHSTSNIAGISQTFTLGENIDTNALFTFDYATFTQNRSKMRVKIDGSESGNLLDDTFYSYDTSWTEYESDLDVVAGEEITVTYYSRGTNAIDGVSFLVNEKKKKFARKVPEPTSILGLAAISGLAAASLKRKRKSSDI